MSGTWEKFIDAAVADRYRLRRLTYGAREQAEFAADGPEAGQPVTVTLIRPGSPGDAPAMLAEMRAAGRLQHPNILRILDAGEWTSGEEPLLYLATETAEETLAQAAPRLVSSAGWRAFAIDVLAGLQFLHQQGLAYCNLEPESTVRVGDRWKLADLSRVCPLGASGEAASPAAGSRYAPPEAATAAVSAAWDSWAFGSMLKALGGMERLPSGFAAAIKRCLDRDPKRRPSLEELHSLVAPPPVAAAAPRQEPVSVKVPVVSARAGSEEPESVALPVLSEQVEEEDKPVKWRSGNIAAIFVLAVVCISATAFFLRTGTHGGPAAAPAAKPVAQEEQEPPAPVQKPSALGPSEGSVPSQDSAASEGSAPGQSATADEAQPLEQQKPVKEPADSRVQQGLADYASSDMDGHPTASGELFNSNALAAAADGRYGLGTRLRVTNPSNQHSVIVKVNDRGRFRRGHIIRLTKRAAEELGIARAGSARVKVEVLK